MFPYRVRRCLQSVTIVLFIFTEYSDQCTSQIRPSRRPYSKHKFTPFVHKQHDPNVSEFAIGASEPPDGPITRSDPRFKELVENHNPDIIFRDEERDGSDRIMTQRCKEKLNNLARLVQNQWPGNPPEVPPVKLRVKEAWDDNSNHGDKSLHYEGRAVDVATDDRDRSKLGLLARLAVDAGFDWVEYESHGHIHCSVKSDQAAAVRGGGCFSGSDSVQLEDGREIPISDMRIGDKVLSMRSDGELGYSEVITFMDRDDLGYGVFYTLSTDSGKEITLTAKHLLYVVKQNSSFDLNNIEAIFAETVTVGQHLLLNNKGRVIPSVVTKITVETKRGVYAPLTKHGTIVVNGVIASCYAYINNLFIAHTVFAPMRVYHDISQYFTMSTRLSSDIIVDSRNSTNIPTGMHWYAKLLYSIGTKILSPELLYVH